MSPQEINDAIVQLFSEEGLQVNGFWVTLESPVIANIFHDDVQPNANGSHKVTSIKFGPNLPKVKIKKFITLYAYIEELVLGEEGGTVKIKNFPDFSFAYNAYSRTNSHKCDIDCQSIAKEIDCKYSEKSHKQIAKKCLQYAEEWATICHQTGINFENSDFADRYVYYNQCYDFVKENIEEDVKERHGSVILTWLFVYVVLPMIIKWVVNKVLERLFND